MSKSENSNAVPKQLKPFVKGDPRINRKGRPRVFDELRSMTLEIMNTNVARVAKEMGVVVKPEYEKLTCAGYLIRKWIFSGEPVLQKAAMEIAYGKVPDKIDLTNNGQNFDAVNVIIHTRNATT